MMTVKDYKENSCVTAGKVDYVQEKQPHHQDSENLLGRVLAGN